MKIRFTRRHRVRSAAGTWRGKPVNVRYVISPVTGNLFATGTFDGESLLAQVNRDGANLVLCDALGRRDAREFVQELVTVCKFKVKHGKR